MTEPHQLQRQLMTRIALSVFPFAVLGLLFGQWRVALGFILGGVGALVYVRILVLDVKKLTQLRNPQVASKLARRGYAKRLLFLGAILIVPFFNPWFHPASTALGLLSIKAAIYLGEFITYLNNRDK